MILQTSQILDLERLFFPIGCLSDPPDSDEPLRAGGGQPGLGPEVDAHDVGVVPEDAEELVPHRRPSASERALLFLYCLAKTSSRASGTGRAALIRTRPPCVSSPHRTLWIPMALTSLPSSPGSPIFDLMSYSASM